MATARYPDFLHIGYSKAASTWLQDVLRQDPDIFLVYKSYFFFPLNSERYAKGLDHYAGFFEEAEQQQLVVESQEHIILPDHHPVLKCAVTNLALVRQIAERIQANLPNVKIVVIIRNQEDMLISRYLQYVLQGGSYTPEQFYAALGENDFRTYADYRYGKVIEVLWDVFGRDRVLVLMQEELKQGADQLLQRLGDFMGHRFKQPETSGRKKNVGASYKGIRWIRTVNRWWVREVETTHAPTQTKVPHALWWGLTVALRKLDNWLVRQKEKARLMGAADRQRMRAAFAEDNRHLEQLLGRPVKPLGYHYD